MKNKFAIESGPVGDLPEPSPLFAAEDDIAAFPVGEPRSIERGTWWGLAMSLLLHSALVWAICLSAVPRATDQRDYIHVQLISSCGGTLGSGEGQGGTSAGIEPGKSAASGGDAAHPPVGEPAPNPPAPVVHPRVPGKKPVPVHKIGTADPAVSPPERAKPERQVLTAAHPSEDEAPVSHEPPADTAASDSGTPVGGTGSGAGTVQGTGTGAGGHPGGNKPGGAGGYPEVGFGSPGGPRFLHKVMPAYPLFARKQDREGTVLLRVTINEAGRVVDIEVLKKAGFGFDEEAVKAIRESTFVPAMKEGKTLTCRALLPVRFELTTAGIY